MTSVRRSRLPSKSKIPPQFVGANAQVLQFVGDGVELFGFHGSELLVSERPQLYPKRWSLFQQVSYLALALDAVSAALHRSPME
jgi:hypothetical protein